MAAFDLLYAIAAAFAAVLAFGWFYGPRSAIAVVPTLAVLGAWLVFALDIALPVSDGWAVYLGGAAFPLLLVAVTVRAWGGGGYRSLGLRRGSTPYRILLLSALLVGVYLLFNLEPGLVFGVRTAPSPGAGDFALYFLTTPLLVLGQEAVFRGFFLSRLAERVPLSRSLFASAGLFALTALNPFVVADLSLGGLGEYLFLNVVTAVLLGLVAGIYFYRADWSLLGPFVFRTGVLWAAFFLPWSPSAPWATVFVFDLLALGAVFALVYVLLEEPRYRARHYLGEPMNPRRRRLIAGVRARRETLRTGIAVVAVAVVLVLVLPPLVRGNGSPVRFDAIATGSMVPTLSVGTLVVIVPIPAASDIHVGEIVAYNAPYLSTAGPVVHRVVAIRNSSSGPIFTFKGDHNPTPDPRPVVFSQVVGRVVADAPLLGDFVLSPALSASVIAGIVLLAAYVSTPGPKLRRRPLIPLRGDELR